MAAVIVCFVVAVVCLIISILQFQEKGFCYNNAYLYASKEERKKMDKKPHYRQSAIVFLLLFFIFAVIGIYAITYATILLIVEAILLAAVLIYAIVSGIRIDKR